MLKLDQVQGGYGSIEVLKGVSLQVPERSIVTLLGANGAGKTPLCAPSPALRPQAAG